MRVGGHLAEDNAHEDIALNFARRAVKWVTACIVFFFSRG
jgi:hypothetical protein